MSFVALVAMWEAMMIGMMAPTVAPWLRTFDRLTSEGRDGGRAARVASFAGGYATVWLGYSAVAAAAQILLHRAGWLGHTHVLAAPLGALVFIGAGLYQFAPAKRACLTHCRNPLTHMLGRWRNGGVSGFRIGLAHGAYCVGCCWAIMATAFAVGVMNVWWMAALAAVVAIEQVAPHGDWIRGTLGLAMTGWGVVLLAG